MIVELDTPKHLDTELFFENIGKLDEANIDAVTLADNSLATRLNLLFISHVEIGI